LHTFNEYTRNNYNPKLILINNIFTLYKTIEKIYKYNYIIYIFEKKKKKILEIKYHNVNNDINILLKKNLDTLFNSNFKKLKN